MKSKWNILRTTEFQEWLSAHSEKHQNQINESLALIEIEGYFGIHKLVDEEEEVWELKWTIGWRVYYVFIDKVNILLLSGGNKNGQNKDIKKAKKISKSYQKLERI